MLSRPFLKKTAFPLFLATLAWLVLSSLTAAASSDERLVNGGFEEPIGSEWGTPDRRGSITQVESPIRQGSLGKYAAKFTSTTGYTRWVSQVVQVVPLENYIFSGYLYKDDPNIKEVYLRISWYESEDGFGSKLFDGDSEHLTENDEEYHLLTVSSIAPNNAHSARVKIMVVVASSTITATAHFDDMSFIGPEPPPETEDSEDTSEEDSAEDSGNNQEGDSTDDSEDTSTSADSDQTPDSSQPAGNSTRLLIVFLLALGGVLCLALGIWVLKKKMKQV